MKTLRFSASRSQREVAIVAAQGSFYAKPSSVNELVRLLQLGAYIEQLREEG